MIRPVVRGGGGACLEHRRPYSPADDDPLRQGIVNLGLDLWSNFNKDTGDPSNGLVSARPLIVRL